MTRLALAGALALALTGAAPALAQDAARTTAQTESRTVLLSRANIQRFKTTLRLTPEQEPYWITVTMVLRDLAREQEAAGVIARMGHRVTNVLLDSAAVQRLTIAARPLIKSLDDAQRREALKLVNAMGISQLAGSF